MGLYFVFHFLLYSTTNFIVDSEGDFLLLGRITVLIEVVPNLLLGSQVVDDSF